MDVNDILSLAEKGSRTLQWLDQVQIAPESGITVREYVLQVIKDASTITLREREVSLPGLSSERYINAIMAVIDEFCSRVQSQVKPIYNAGIDDVVIVPAHDFPKGFNTDTFIRTGLKTGKIDLIPTGTGYVGFDNTKIIFVLTDLIDLNPNRGLREVYITADGRRTYAVPVRKMRIDDVPVVPAPLEVVENRLDIDGYLETGDSVEFIPDGIFIMKYSKYQELLGL